MIVTANRSFYFVDQEGLRRLMSWLGPKFTVKGRHCMSRELTPLLHKNAKTAMDKILAKDWPHSENVAFTSDEWQSKAQNSYLSLTFHYINYKFETRKFRIACRSTENTQENTKSALIASMIDDIKGLKSKERCTRTMVHDIRLNKKAKESEAIDHQIFCLNHVINNTLKEALAHKDMAESE